MAAWGRILIYREAALRTASSSGEVRRLGSQKPFTPVDLVKRGASSPEMVAFLWLAVESGHSVMICGNRDTGRTSTLNALAFFIRPEARIVSVEHRPEIAIPHTHWTPHTTQGSVVGSEDSPAEEEAAAHARLNEAIRQRVDFILVGDLRGTESFPMFGAMNSGPPVMSTFEADSVRALVYRLGDPPLNLPRIVMSALDLVVVNAQVDTDGTPSRRMTHVVEVVGYDRRTNEMITNTVFEWEPKASQFKFNGHSYVHDRAMETRKTDSEAIQRDMQRRVDLVNHMVRRDMADPTEIHNLIASYHRDPLGTWKRIREAEGAPADPPQPRPPVDRIK